MPIIAHSGLDAPRSLKLQMKLPSCRRGLNISAKAQRKSKAWRLLLLLGVLICAAQVSSGQTPPTEFSKASTEEKLTQLDQRTTAAQSSGDNAWMLVAAALVLMMSGPGLALFYGGLVRKKNMLANDDADFCDDGGDHGAVGVGGLQLMFWRGNAFIGGLHNVFLRGVGLAPDAEYAATIPLQTFMVYQLMFAIITPALITGAFAERMKFSAMLVFMVLWALVVYSPMAHMVWGKGGLLNASLGGKFPTLDFAGGTVVHVTSGVSALVTALYLRKRTGYPKVPMPPHSVVLSFIGACLLWVGWFGFNAGSALSAKGGWRLRRLWRRILRRRLRRWGGAWRSG